MNLLRRLLPLGFSKSNKKKPFGRSSSSNSSKSKKSAASSAKNDTFNNNKGANTGLTAPSSETLGPVSTKSESSSKSGSVQPGTLDDVSPASALEALMQDEADCAADRFGKSLKVLPRDSKRRRSQN
ncbi:unnamed protein product [Aureobasidium pullulans]|nr:unnamed protein product [Aureobasidium pullulans]